MKNGNMQNLYSFIEFENNIIPFWQNKTVELEFIPKSKKKKKQSKGKK